MTMHMTELDSEEFDVWVKVPGDEFYVGRVSRQARHWYFDAIPPLSEWPATLRTWARQSDHRVRLPGFNTLGAFEASLNN